MDTPQLPAYRPLRQDTGATYHGRRGARQGADQSRPRATEADQPPNQVEDQVKPLPPQIAQEPNPIDDEMRDLAEENNQLRQQAKDLTKQVTDLERRLSDIGSIIVRLREEQIL
jgi:hypothetical protein